MPVCPASCPASGLHSLWCLDPGSRQAGILQGLVCAVSARVLPLPQSCFLPDHILSALLCAVQSSAHIHIVAHITWCCHCQICVPTTSVEAGTTIETQTINNLNEFLSTPIACKPQYKARGRVSATMGVKTKKLSHRPAF